MMALERFHVFFRTLVFGFALLVLIISLAFLEFTKLFYDCFDHPPFPYPLQYNWSLIEGPYQHDVDDDFS
jgi:hypothetical protein